MSLVVNVASECGFTEEHYKDLQQLQRDFGPYHFNVLAFPCNQFGQQEPGSDKDIDSFVRRVYGVSFPLFSKIAVVGTGANNVYKYLVGKFGVDAFCPETEQNVFRPFHFGTFCYVLHTLHAVMRKKRIIIE